MLKPQKWLFFTSALCVILGAVLESLHTYIFNLFVESVDHIEDETYQGLGIFEVFMWFIALRVVISVVWYIRDLSWGYFSPTFRQSIRQKLFDHIQKHPTQYFINNFAGQISLKISDASDSAVEIVEIISHDISYVLLIATMSIALLGITDIYLVTAFLGWLVIYLVINLVSARLLYHRTHLQTEARTKISGQLVDSISNYLTVKLFTSQNREGERFAKFNIDERDKNLNRQIAYVYINTVKTIMHTLLIIVLSVIAYHLWEISAVSSGGMVMAITIAYMMTNRLSSLSDHILRLFEEIGRLQSSLDLIIDNASVQDSSSKTVSINGAICLENLSFEYLQDQPVLENFNLSIPKGQKIGLVGHSGAGKSTLINLILGFYQPIAGKIHMDGHEASILSRHVIRAHIAVIPQDTSLFHRSLMENIRYGRADASDDEVIEAAKKAHADEFITELPQGYETLVGERGVKLSGGQRQRIAIARAILKDAPILILDEATSALDSESEQLIQESLKELMQGKTVIAIAHRLSTIAHLDRLIVMDQGQIIEDGRHEELLDQNGTYAKLWNMQSGGFLGE